MAAEAEAAAGAEDVPARIEALRRERDAIRQEHRDGLREYHGSFHNVWGQLMKTGYQNSRFANQARDARAECLRGRLFRWEPVPFRLRTA